MSFENRNNLIDSWARRDHSHANEIVLYMTDAERQAMASPKDGQFVFTTDTDYGWAYSSTYGWKRFAADPIERWLGDIGNEDNISVTSDSWATVPNTASSNFTPTVNGTLFAEAIALLRPDTTATLCMLRIALFNDTDDTWEYSRQSGGHVTDAQYICANPLRADFPLVANNTYSIRLQVYQAAADQTVDVHQIHTSAVEGVLGSGSVLADSSLFVLKSGSITQIASRSHTDLSSIGTNTHAQIDTHIAATNPHSESASLDDAYFYAILFG